MDRPIRRVVAALATVALVSASCSAVQREEAPGAKAEESKPSSSSLSLEEWANRMVDCVNAAGFPAQTTPDGEGFGVEHSPDQRELVADLVAKCEEQLVGEGLLPDPSATPSLAMIREMYETAMAEHECLLENGLPTTQAPSWDTYLEGILSQDEERVWNPFEKVFEAAYAGDEEPLVRASELCESES